MQPIPLRKYPSPSRDDVIYMAGLFDGEGCVGIYRRGGSRGTKRQTTQYMMYAQLSTTCEPLMIWVRSTFSGTSCRENDKETTNPKWSTAWRWKTNSRHARWFLELIVPFLKIKREQALLAIEFQKHIEDYKSRVHRGTFRGGILPLPSEEIKYRESISLELKGIKKSEKQRLGRVAA